LAGAGNGQSAGRLEDGTRILEDVLDRGADGVGIDEDDFVEYLAADAEGLLADELDRRTVGEQADLLQADTLAGGERTGHRVGIVGLDADDLGFRPQPLDVGAAPGRQPAAANGDKNGMNRFRMLAQDLHPDRPLAGNHFGIVEGMDEGQLFLLLEFECVGVGLVVRITGEDDLAAPAPDRLHLDLRRRRRHHDHRPAADPGRRQRHALCVIAGRSADHAALQLCRGQLGDLVVGTAQLEREHRLHILALQVDAVVGPRRQAGSKIQRRLDGDVVDLRVEDFFQIVRVHVALLFLEA